MARPDPHIEHKIDGDLVFDGKLLKVWCDRVRRDGESGEWTREYIRHPGATMVIAITDAGKILFERQFRYPLGQILIEMPAGKIDPGEPHALCAQRELEEETGYRARHWQHLGGLHPAVGYADERIEIHLARGLEFVGQKLDHGEYLEVIELSLEEAEAAVIGGEITDSKTITGIFWARRVLSGTV